MCIRDRLVGVNVKELDKAANGDGDNDTELIILMIGLAGLILTIGIVGAWAKRELDRMHRQSISSRDLTGLELGGIDGVDNPIGSALPPDDDPIVLEPTAPAQTAHQQQPPPPPSPAAPTANASPDAESTSTVVSVEEGAAPVTNAAPGETPL